MSTDLNENAMKSIEKLKKIITAMMVVGFIFYGGFLFGLYGLEDRLPSRFIEYRMPKNSFLYFRIFSLFCFLLLVPAYLFLLKLKKRLSAIQAGAQDDLNKVWSDLSSLFLAMIIPWLLYAVFMCIFGYRIMKMSFVSFN